MMTDPSRNDDRPDVGLLLVGHGTRMPEGVAEFRETARLVADRLAPWVVEPCFLEFAEPAIAAGFEALVARGVGRVVVAPVMLFAAAHVRHDIPAAVSAAAAGHPGVSVCQAEHFGCHEAIVELSKRRYDEVLAGKPPVPAAETVLVLVGRGSHDEQATAEMRRFTAMRSADGTVARAETGFLAMAEPPLADVLERVALTGARRVVVQPHLLFGGVLLDRIGTLVGQFASQYPGAQWLVAAHLGACDLVVRAIESRALAALAGPTERAAGGACRK